ncbi:MAG TPA: glycyl-radical enzyme activating protein [Syntrophorhabdaceae bacterium]|nr:glycyl-radical enzyme activating protein [Syntrophorhabdaceae bacterium]
MVEADTVKGIVFDIQRYSIHDGPGIRTTVFLKGCPLRCLWCQNPESQVLEPEILLNNALCSGCGQCVAVCAAAANSLSGTHSQIDRTACLKCGTCVAACPNQARRLSGKQMSVGEVLNTVKKDLKFYETSGGGITLSGGEATFQHDFALALLKKSRELKIHTTLETCGYASWNILEELLPYIDLVLYDIKHWDPERHQRGTGVSNQVIIENAKRIAELKPMKVRVPLIPLFNDSEHDIRSIASFVGSLPNQIEMELLAYNPLGEGKYERLGKGEKEHKETQEQTYIDGLRGIAESELRKSRLHLVR